MICWKVIIDEVDVSAFVPQDSLDGLTIQVEGNQLFDYRTNDIAFDLDIAALELFELLLSEFESLKHTTSNHRPVNIYRYDQKVFGGYVSNLSHTKNDHFLQLDAISIDSMVVKTILDAHQHVKGSLGSNSTPFETENPDGGGDTLSQIVSRFIWLVNLYSTSDGGPILLDETPSIDVVDFTAYGTLIASQIEIPTFVTSDDGEDQEWTRLEGIFRDLDGNKFLVYEHPNPLNHSSFGWVALSESGAADTLEIRTHSIANNVARYSDAEENLIIIGYRETSFSDSNVQAAAEVQLGLENGNYIGKTLIGSTYYGIYKVGGSDFTYFSLILDEIDKYLYYYDAPTAGKVLHDLGIMTDSLVWIDPDGVLHFQSRSGISELPSIPGNQVQSISTKTLDHQKEKLELPEAFIIAASVREQIIDHYDPVFRGAFNRYEIVVEEEAVAGQTLPLRSFPIDGQDYGVVKALVLHESSIELTAEKRS